MRIDPRATLYGFPSIEVRDFVKRYSYSRWTLDDIEDWFDIDESNSQQLVEALESAGYIEQDPRDCDWWIVTEDGLRLAAARATKPINRSTADRHFAAFLERVEQANSDMPFAYRVRRALVFGSYLDPSIQKLSDLDLAVELIRRHSDSEKQGELNDDRVRVAIDEGRSFHSTLEQIAWPQIEVMKFLKARSNTISLHPVSEVLEKGWPHQIIFDSDEMSPI